MNWELTPFEIDEAWAHGDPNETLDVRVGRAYQKKLVEWQDEPCEHIPQSGRTVLSRRHCNKCWEKLKKGVGL